MSPVTFAIADTPNTCARTPRSQLMPVWRDRLAIPANHNSITTAPAVAGTPAKAGVVYGAAKQAGPPRGIPR